MFFCVHSMFPLCLSASSWPTGAKWSIKKGGNRSWIRARPAIYRSHTHFTSQANSWVKWWSYMIMRGQIVWWQTPELQCSQCRPMWLQIQWQLISENIIVVIVVKAFVFFGNTNIPTHCGYMGIYTKQYVSMAKCDAEVAKLIEMENCSNRVGLNDRAY